MLSVKADFTQPDLLGENSALTWSLIYDLGIDYAYQYHGPGTRIGITKSFLRDRLKLAASYNFQLLSFFNTDPVILSDPGAAGALYGLPRPALVLARYSPSGMTPPRSLPGGTRP
mgnify:CR=1 FL=1